jgi:hypothetical protein
MRIALQEASSAADAVPTVRAQSATPATRWRIAKYPVIAFPFCHLIVLLNNTNLGPVKAAFFDGFQKDFLWQSVVSILDGCAFSPK